MIQVAALLLHSGLRRPCFGQERRYGHSASGDIISPQYGQPTPPGGLRVSVWPTSSTRSRLSSARPIPRAAAITLAMTAISASRPALGIICSTASHSSVAIATSNSSTVVFDLSLCNYTLSRHGIMPVVFVGHQPGSIVPDNPESGITEKRRPIDSAAVPSPLRVAHSCHTSISPGPTVRTSVAPGRLNSTSYPMPPRYR